MNTTRQKSIEQHLTNSELDAAIDEAEQADEARLVRRLCFIRNLYLGDTLTEAARRVGMSPASASRWSDAWNEAGVVGLQPSFGAGRPRKLSEMEEERLINLLKAGQPWTTQEIRQLLQNEFGVQYHPNYVSRVLSRLGMHYAKPRPNDPNRPADAEETLTERLNAALGEAKTDGEYVIGFFDACWPQPTDNSQRLWAFETPQIEKNMPRVDCPVLGFYSLNGESVIDFTENQTKESICAAFERIREQNPARRILLVLDNFSSHTCTYTRERAAELGIDLVFLPPYSPHLNLIEQVWKSLKWEISPISAESADAFRALVRDTFNQLTQNISFAADWAETFLDFQSLS